MCIRGRALDGAKASRRLWRLDLPVYALAAPFNASDASRYEIMASTTSEYTSIGSEIACTVACSVRT